MRSGSSGDFAFAYKDNWKGLFFLHGIKRNQEQHLQNDELILLMHNLSG
jgi:hypothetical protein